MSAENPQKGQMDAVDVYPETWRWYFGQPVGYRYHGGGKSHYYYDYRNYTPTWLIFLVVWLAFGIPAFLMSLFCFSKSGGTRKHLLASVMALLLGPFYWIYFVVDTKYCR